MEGVTTRPAPRRGSRRVQRHELGGGAHARPAGDVGLEVEALDGGRVLELAPARAGEHPHDLELVAVGVLPVDALRRAVARLAAVGAEADQRGAGLDELVDGVELPGQVVEASDPRGRGGWAPTPNRPRSWWLPERGRRRNAAFARGSLAMTVIPNAFS